MQRPGECPPIYFVPGDHVRLPIALKNSDGTPHNLTGATVEAQVRAVSGADDDPLLATFAVIGDLDETGELLLQLSPGSTTSLRGKKNLAWDMQVTYASSIVRTVVAGVLHPLKDVTQ